MDDLINDLKGIASKQNDSDDYLLMNSKYVPSKIDVKNFHPITLAHDVVNNPASNSSILFVDGGQGLLFESAEFCIGLIRVGGTLYRNNMRISRSKKEFHILIKENDGKFVIKTYPEMSFDKIIFDPDDETLRNGIEKCNIGKIVSIIRRFAELEYACENSSDVDYVLLDGTLEARYSYEDKYLDNLLRSGKVCAIAKTCSLTTRNGYSITYILSGLSPSDFYSWYYYPIVANNNFKHPAEMYFIKLNKKSSYVFRFEIQKNFKGNVERLFSMLTVNSADPVFLGYPYGFIDIDQYVRVSDDESRILRTKLSARLGKDWNDFSKHLNSINAHSILDKIKF